MFQIEVFLDKNEFLNELHSFDICTNPYQSYAYYFVYLKYYGNLEFRFFRVIDSDSNIRALLPFYCYKKIGTAELLRFVGYGQFNYEGYICEKRDIKDVHYSFVDYIMKSHKKYVIDFFDINTTDELLDSLNNTTCRKTSIRLYGCPIVSFKEKNFDDFFKNAFRESKKRSELKKFQRKLEAIGKVEIVNLCGEESYDAYSKYIPYLYDVFAKRFAGVYATSFFSSPSMRNYYDELIEKLVKDEKGFISIMLLDEVPIAFIFCLSNNDTLIDWIPAFDPAFSKYNLGTVQYKMLFEKLFEEGKYKYFDFSKGSTVYKKKWSKNETFNWQIIVNFAPNNVFSSLLFITYSCFFRFKTWSRNHGLNEKIKFFIGDLQINRLIKENTVIKIHFGDESIDKSMLQPISYKSWAHLPVSDKTIILELIYSGNVIEKIDKHDDIYIFTMRK